MALIAGVGAHLALHWSWLVCITGRMVRDLFKLLKPARRLETQCEVM